MASPSPISKQQSVSNVGNRKRRNTYDAAHSSPPTKRIKSISVARITSNFPPQFWDNLSKVWLTPRALREKDRRNDIQPPAINPAIVRATPTSLSRFARRGGPDLRHLRGYPEPKHAASMSSNRSSNRRTLSTKAISIFSRAKRSSAYDKDFEQNLIDHNIYPEGFKHTDGRTTPEPNNLDSIVESLAYPRASLSPSQFSISAFKSFRAANSQVVSKGKVMADILPTIRGNSEILNEGNLPFANLKSITNGTTVDAVPNWYDGSYTKEISKTVRQGPTSHAQAPVVPNFFIEAKAPRGGADVAKRQACLDGAVGARAMHSLQNYGEDVPVCDGNAYTFSSTYHAGTGTLQLYAHHATGPTAEEEQPEYHMTQIDSWGMTGNVDTFRRGATAFRNARDLARQQRETFIKAANARVSQEAAPVEKMEQTYKKLMLLPLTERLFTNTWSRLRIPRTTAKLAARDTVKSFSSGKFPSSCCRSTSRIPFSVCQSSSVSHVAKLSYAISLAGLANRAEASLEVRAGTGRVGSSGKANEGHGENESSLHFV
ncbi:hypothetical protein A9K55_005004 [Cordyceps militaris]|uniref:DUF7924 domain-containing protein n=1 Tax=Cordyceps militaris TaxID=73501 RepID=A0A2H4SPK6_CORMI|nr:hypothetical protein A9K55_005004 [Cordyceps militaris]